MNILNLPDWDVYEIKGRRGIGYEISEPYCQLAVERCKQAALSFLPANLSSPISKAKG